MRQGYITACACTPRLALANPSENADRIIQMLDVAHKHNTTLAVFPELALIGGCCGSLLQQHSLYQAVEDGILRIMEKTAESDVIAVFGAPVVNGGRLYNCAVVVGHGTVFGVIPQKHVTDPAFSPADDSVSKILIGELSVDFGTELIFESLLLPELRLAVAVGNDYTSPFSTLPTHTAAGATVIAALCSQSIPAGNLAQARDRARTVSAELGCALICADSGSGEDSCDGIHYALSLIAENGIILRASSGQQDVMIPSDIDVQLLQAVAQKRRTPAPAKKYQTVYFNTKPVVTPITRLVSPGPFVWPDESSRDIWCQDILDCQINYLVKKVKTLGYNTLTILLDGNTASSVAAFVCARAAQQLGWTTDKVIGIICPSDDITRATTNRAMGVAKNLGFTECVIDVSDMYRSRLEVLGVDGEKEPDMVPVIRRRCQMSVAADVAWQVGGLPVLTEDMTDWALDDISGLIDPGACCINASLPKTVLRFVLIYITAQQEHLRGLYQVLQAVLTEDNGGASPDKSVARKDAEQLIFTPLQMNDFFIYHVVNHGFGPVKLMRLAEQAFGSQLDDCRIYDCLQKFVRSFFAGQFTRQGMPEGPDPLGVSLKNFRFSSEADLGLWLREIELLRPEGYQEEMEFAPAQLPQAPEKQPAEQENFMSKEEFLRLQQLAQKQIAMERAEEARKNK